MSKLSEKLRLLIEQMNEDIRLAKDDLLKNERLFETKHHVQDELKKIAESKEISEKNKLRIEKVVPRWRNQPKSGIWINEDKAINSYSPLISLCRDLLAEEDSDTTKPTAADTEYICIEKGKPFKGASFLRSIFSTAEEKIIIKDNYLSPDVLEILEEQLIENEDLSVRLLASSKLKGKLRVLKIHFQCLKDQYPHLNLKCRYGSNKHSGHPRYIFIDENVLFQPDHSLDEWGYDEVNIHKIDDPQSVKDRVESFNSIWEDSEPIDNYEVK